MAKDHYDSKNKEKFQKITQESVKRIESNLLRYGDILLAGVSYVNSSDNVNQQGWHDFVSGLNIEERYPGMQGYGFSIMLKPNEVVPFEQKMHMSGKTSFTLKPQGARELYSTILYLEPFSRRNAYAIGYDMYSNTTRKMAMDMARDSGKLALSGKVILVQEIDKNKQMGFLLYAPVYKKNTDINNLQERRKGLLGFVYSPFRVNDFLNSTGAHTEDLDFNIYDNMNRNNKTLMFNTSKETTYTSKYSTETTLTLYNHTWHITFYSTHRFDMSNEDQDALPITALALVVFFVLLSIIFTLLKRKYLLQKQRDELDSMQTIIIQKKNELMESEFKWKFAVEGSGDGLWDWNLKTNDVYFSSLWKKMLGFADDEIENSLDEWEKRVHPDDIERVHNDIQLHFDQKKPFYSNEHRCLCKDGTYKWILGRGIIVQRSAQGEPIRMIGTNSDISEQKKIANELKEAKETAEASTKSKSDFLATMSHEIRTPMNGVLGMLELLNNTHLDEKQKHLVHIGMSSAQSLLVIINDILDSSKIDEGKLDLENIEFNVINELEDFVKLISFKAEEKQLELKLDTSLITHQNIVTDPGRLRQILTNLVGNAIKFTQNGIISIDASIQNEDSAHARLHINVTDTGIGISQSSISKLFNPFTQADSSTTRKYGGTGLGLSIVKRLCELMGGTVRVKSEPGQGSVFSINILVGLGHNQSASELFNAPKDLENPNTISTIQWPALTRILLVEDDITNQLVAQGMIEHIGLQADIAENGLQALEALRLALDAVPYSLILMDGQMPEMDGYTTSMAIRAGQAGEKNKQIPIIAITANAMVKDREKCLNAGMDDYITKPINAVILKSKLVKWILKEDQSDEHL